MNKYQEIPINQLGSDIAIPANTNFTPLHSINNGDDKLVSKIFQLTDSEEKSTNAEYVLAKERPKKQEKINSTVNHIHNEEGVNACNSTLFRLFVKNGEYVYARPQDILMIESCDHMVKVYLSVNDKPKKTIRHNTLKDFLLQLPQNQFLRIGRFCAVNTQRISGGNCNDQSFEFDFKISIKLKHAISQSAFGNIGS
jgi:hypothetical protein